MLKIEVFQEDVTVTARNMPPKDGKPGRTIYEQRAYAYLGGKFPVQMKLQVEDPTKTYPAGEYQIDSSSFVVNNFGGLELKRFGLTITPITPSISSTPRMMANPNNKDA
ncbi:MULTISPECIES: G5P family DNA-binding protein [unclassified Shewanella]|uniref:G5P family DNA-binding protein n=1 Tax=Shewanella TaxID=22 RepID=UPI0020042697|nr:MULTISPECIES: G5P family DNA-binding protein [unclassified Shewanella]MCK7636166.1 G5P family DNA-binding protein [Shewanella sp. JNE17]MCK7651337.1 G5P family DNA-binding protein [Shewanella sp. JNE8]MCK7659556.1 G5P family DNA-binding protein [Shewanella sp. JNE4-2]UPO33117.1 G5P family DNA-binding protein [Shewanella sp. JNE2]